MTPWMNCGLCNFIKIYKGIIDPSWEPGKMLKVADQFLAIDSTTLESAAFLEIGYPVYWPVSNHCVDNPHHLLVTAFFHDPHTYKVPLVLFGPFHSPTSSWSLRDSATIHHGEGPWGVWVSTDLGFQVTQRSAAVFGGLERLKTQRFLLRTCQFHWAYSQKLTPAS